ncbi:MAG: ribokinase [Alphaproteobacteria bacterium]
MTHTVCILGIFVADLTFVAPGALPHPGETALGREFRIGPGGKGSNQAVAARRAGAEVTLIAKIGADTFGDMAHELYAAEGISDRGLIDSQTHPTGAAGIFLSEETGENAIVVTPGAAGAISVAEAEAAIDLVAAADIFLTQFEVPLPVAQVGLRLAKSRGVRTVLNPAPAASVSPQIWSLADIVTPNESEAGALSGHRVTGPAEAANAGRYFLDRGAGAVVITLGANGVFLMDTQRTLVVAAHRAGPLVETTGAGDSFNGAMAAALAEGQDLENAVRFGNAAAAISVTRPGTAPAMPTRREIEKLLARKT